MMCASILSSPPSPAPRITKSLSKTDLLNTPGVYPLTSGRVSLYAKENIWSQEKYKVVKNKWILLHLPV